MLKTNSNQDFRQQVYSLVKKIPEGKVVTYGQISKELRIMNCELRISQKMVVLPFDDAQGKALLARAVGNALHCNADPSVPCHRVVDRNGRLAPNFAFDGAKEQRRRLLAEGVKFVDEVHVDLSKSVWK